MTRDDRCQKIVAANFRGRPRNVAGRHGTGGKAQRWGHKNVFKFTAAPESVYIFSKMGTEPWMRWVQGLWELFASIGLLVPRLKWAGGILTTGAMLAAILSHMTWLGYSIRGDHGLLFGMALVSFTCGFTVMILHRHEIPFVTPLSAW